MAGTAAIDLGNPTTEGFRRRSCASKVGHSSRKSARRAARLTAQGTNDRLHAYSCRFCLAWHVGHPMSLSRRAQLVPS
jgi:hypothetical protein